MSYTRPHHTGLKELLQSKTFRIGMTATLGAAIAVTCLIIFGSSSNAAAITKVGKLLIDTDAGADDAVAILMALEAERIHSSIAVVGITCVNGNTYVDNVVNNVLKTLGVVDRLNISVYKGAEKPLLMDDEKSDYFGKDGFGDFDYPYPLSPNLLQEKHAVNAMIELVKASPGEITLLALGPLTNVALAIRMYSSFLNDLRQLIILGGSSEGIGTIRPGIEYNFGVDPIANYIVFNASNSKPVIMVASETAKRAKLTKEFRTSLNEIDNLKLWLINSAESVSLNRDDEFWECADAVATTVALTSGTIVTKSIHTYLDAIYDGPITAGMIVVDYTNLTQKTPNTILIQDIDVEEYKKLLLTYLS